MAKKIETPKGTHGKPRLSSAAIASRLQAKIHEREEANKRDRLRIASIANPRLAAVVKLSALLDKLIDGRPHPGVNPDVYAKAREQADREISEMLR